MGCAEDVYAGTLSADVVASARYGLLLDRRYRTADLLSLRAWSICLLSSRCSVDSGCRGGLPFAERDPLVDAYPPSDAVPIERPWPRRLALLSELAIIPGQGKDSLPPMENEESREIVAVLGGGLVGCV